MERLIYFSKLFANKNTTFNVSIFTYYFYMKWIWLIFRNFALKYLLLDYKYMYSFRDLKPLKETQLMGSCPETTFKLHSKNLEKEWRACQPNCILLTVQPFEFIFYLTHYHSLWRQGETELRQRILVFYVQFIISFFNVQCEISSSSGWSSNLEINNGEHYYVYKKYINC